MNDPSSELIREFDVHTGSVQDIEFMPETNSLIISGTGIMQMPGLKEKLQNQNSVRTASTNQTNTDELPLRVSSFDILEEHQLLVAGSHFGGDITLWNLETGAMEKKMYAHDGVVNRVEYSPNGFLFATAGQDHKAITWNALSTKPIGVLEGHAREVTSVKFSPDGEWLATSSNDGTVRLWNIAEHTFIPEWRTH